MADKMKNWGAGPRNIIALGPIVIGMIETRSPFAHGADEKLIQDTQSMCTLAAVARLDEREELGSALGIDRPDMERLSDAALILRAYLKWGFDCLAKLYGDWSMALWDERKKRLLLARDATGISGLYYRLDKGEASFASSIKSLTPDAPSGGSLNQSHAAKFLIQYPEDSNTTLYQNVFRLRTGEALTISGTMIQRRRYWSAEDYHPLRSANESSLNEEFLHLYRQAVSSRISRHGRTSLLLSSGLDSSSVAALAAPICAQKDEKLHCLTHVPAFTDSEPNDPGRFANERPLVEEIAADNPGLSCTFHSTPNRSPMAGIREGLSYHGEPEGAAGNQYWLHELVRGAKAGGADVLLTGQAGNFSVSWTGGPDFKMLADCIRGRWHHVAAAYANWSQFTGQSGLSFIRSQLLRPLIPDRLAAIRRWQNGQGIDITNAFPINPKFAKSSGVEDMLRERGFTASLPYIGPSLEFRRRRYVNIVATTAGATWNELGNELGLVVCDPTSDRRLVEFCLTIPNSAYYSQGISRSLIRNAMRKNLPASILRAKLRGRQSSDLPSRLHQHYDDVHRTLENVEASEIAAHLLNLGRIRKAVEKMKTSPSSVDLRTAHLDISRGLAFGSFISGFG